LLPGSGDRQECLSYSQIGCEVGVVITRTFGIVGIAILISGITGIWIRGVEMLTAGMLGITMFGITI
jgi:hypothetical protein